MTWHMYLRILQRSWWIVALTTLAAITTALLVAYFERPMYRASARLVVSPVPSLENERNLFDSLDPLDNLMATYVEILNSDTVWQETLATLQLTSSDMRRFDRTSVVLPESNILEITVVGPQPQLTAVLANTLGREGISFGQGLYQIYEMSLLDTASVPDSSFSPTPVRTAGVAAMLGGLIGAGLALVRDQLGQFTGSPSTANGRVHGPVGDADDTVPQTPESQLNGHAVERERQGQ